MLLMEYPTVVLKFRSTRSTQSAMPKCAVFPGGITCDDGLEFFSSKDPPVSTCTKTARSSSFVTVKNLRLSLSTDTSPKSSALGPHLSLASSFGMSTLEHSFISIAVLGTRL